MLRYGPNATVPPLGTLAVSQAIVSAVAFVSLALETPVIRTGPHPDCTHGQDEDGTEQHDAGRRQASAPAEQAHGHRRRDDEHDQARDAGEDDLRGDPLQGRQRRG